MHLLHQNDECYGIGEVEMQILHLESGLHKLLVRILSNELCKVVVNPPKLQSYTD